MNDLGELLVACILYAARALLPGPALHGPSGYSARANRFSGRVRPQYLVQVSLLPAPAAILNDCLIADSVTTAAKGTVSNCCRPADSDPTVGSRLFSAVRTRAVRPLLSVRAVVEDQASTARWLYTHLRHRRHRTHRPEAAGQTRVMLPDLAMTRPRRNSTCGLRKLKANKLRCRFAGRKPHTLSALLANISQHASKELLRKMQRHRRPGVSNPLGHVYLCHGAGISNPSPLGTSAAVICAFA